MISDSDNSASIIGMLSRLLDSYGVKRVVASPGSRCFPLLTAFVRNKNLKVTTVVDERSAGFIALGIAATSQLPVAILCTSGSALLNYGPALSEAYYRNIPIIAITADRPAEWIDQNDGQTLRQKCALDCCVDGCFDIKADPVDANALWAANIAINKALTQSIVVSRRPVQINVQLSEPLKECDENSLDVGYRKIIRQPIRKTPADIETLASQIALAKRVMIFAGQSQPCQKLNRALSRVNKFGNIALICQNTSNLHIDNSINRIDAILSESGDADAKLMPQLLITFGGPMTSRALKTKLREAHRLDHWDIRPGGETFDTYKHLSTTIELDPQEFFWELGKQLDKINRQTPISGDYKSQWFDLDAKASASTREFLDRAPFSDIMAINKVLAKLPDDCNVECSNGMAIRYCDLYDCRRFHKFTANRGVNGIDGSTSTAVGASTAYAGTTVLISGDMSALYDISAFTSGLIRPRFKMVVIDNNGGDIFRIIKPTRHLPEREEHVSHALRFPGRQAAEIARMAYFHADSAERLDKAIDEFVDLKDQPALLVISTPADANAAVYLDYLHRSIKTKRAFNKQSPKNNHI